MCNKNYNPKVSIIVPIYGVEFYIEQCAKSIFNQTYNNIEFIFVDDCSIDNSIKNLESVINKYPDIKENIKVIKHLENKGLASARKTGIYASSGEYLFHLDSDDWLEHDAIESLVNESVATNADICVADFFMNYESGEFKEQVKITNKEDYIGYILERNRQYSWTLCNRLIKREIQLKAMPIDNINMGEDYVTVPRLIHFSNIIIKLDKPIYHYRQSNNNSYTKSLSKKSITDLTSSIEILSNFFKDPTCYQNKLKIGKMRVKYNVCLRLNKETKKLIKNIYPEISFRDGKTNSERLILLLAQMRMYIAIKLIVSFGLYLKKNKKILQNK